MLKGSVYIFASKVFGYLIRLALPIILARLLSKPEYGTYRQFFLFEMFIGTLFQFGVNQSLFYFIPRDERNAGAYFLNSLMLNIGIYLVIFTGIYPLAEPLGRALNMPVLYQFFWLLAPFTLVMMLIAAADYYLLARQMAKQSAVFEILGSAAVSAATVTAAVVTHDLKTIILSLVLARTLRLFAYLVYIHFRLRGFRAGRYFFDVWLQVRYGIVLGLGGTAWSLMLRLHEFFASRYFGLENYAVYAVGNTQIPILRMYLLAIVSVSLGQFARLAKEDDWQGVRRLWDRILASLYGVTLPMILIFLLLSKPLILLMFTEKYADSVDIFRLNVLTWLHMLFNAQLVLRALGRNDVTLWVHLAHLLAAPFVLYGSMQLFGMPGIMAGHCVMLISGRLWSVIMLNRLGVVRLAYLPHPAGILSFYRNVLRNGREWLGQLSSRAVRGL